VVPVRFGGRLRATVNFFSRERARFTRDDLLVGQRVASHIALAMSHHRLAEEARQRMELETRAAALALLDQSLAMMPETADLAGLFDRTSTIARPLLPHDAMVLALMMDDGVHARVYASSGMRPGMPEVVSLPPTHARNDDWEHDL